MIQAVPRTDPSSPTHAIFAKMTIQAEVSLLWALADVFPSSKTVEGDHREAIEAQLCVLVDELDMSQVVVEFHNDSTAPYVLQAAIQAATWLEQGGEPPSSNWLRFTKRKIAPFQDLCRAANQIA
jgi:hypothetical protein